MDHQRDNEKAPESSGTQSSPKGQGAYYSLDTKKPQNGFKAWAAVGLLAMVLAGTGYFASKKMVTDPGQDEVSKQLELKKELIASVLALQDDDYDDKAEKLPVNSVDPEVSHNHENEAPKLDNETQPTPDKQLANPEAAPTAEAVALTAEEDLRATEEAQRNKLAADSATLQTLSDEAVAREARAEAAIRKHKEEHMRLLQQYQNQPAKVGGPVSDVPVQAQLGLYRGILSKCYIHQHDVHWIDDNGTIIDHVYKDTPLAGSAGVARNMINQFGAGVAVIVYEKGYELYSEGELIKAETVD